MAAPQPAAVPEAHVTAEAPTAHVYVCGPARLQDGVEQAAVALGWDPARLHRERFTADVDRKGDPFRSALSMLTFYLNRAGKNLPAARRKTLMRAKDELRRQFGRTQPRKQTRRRRA